MKMLQPFWKMILSELGSFYDKFLTMLEYFFNLLIKGVSRGMVEDFQLCLQLL